METDQVKRSCNQDRDKGNLLYWLLLIHQKATLIISSQNNYMNFFFAYNIF